MNAAARVVSDTGKFNRGLKSILHDELHWLDVPERIEYKVGAMVSGVCTDRHLAISQTTSSQPLMLHPKSSSFTISQPKLSHCTSLSTQHVWLSGVRLRRPNSLEHATRWT